MRDIMSDEHLEPESDIDDESGRSFSRSEVSKAEDEKGTKRALEPDKIEEVVLDEESREALGEMPFSECEKEIILNKDLVKRWKYWIEKRMKKEEKEKLKLQYNYKGNCPLVVPKLNPEISAAMSDTVRTRDKYFLSSQESLAAATTALGQGLTALLRNKGSKDHPIIA